ncbi:tafazzin-like isoform X2 [Ptychodera flava]|uniref:tafazzin-like isoform X2 n=1 Tax=Ptychodera flava TaxID=63121 RepID=UPI00396A3C10
MPLEKGQWVFPKGPSKLFNFGGWLTNGLVGTLSQVGLSCLKWRTILNRTRIRMTPSAHDIVFTKKAHTIFFSLGKCVPVVRGDGVYQRGIDYCIDYANSGGWVHVFPEGKVNMTHEVMRLKWGVGRIIAECRIDPLVIPFWHVGMDEVLPNREPYIPQLGRKVTILVGKPLHFQELLRQLRLENRVPVEIRKTITDAIQHEFISLRAKAEALHYGKQEDSHIS